MGRKKRSGRKGRQKNVGVRSEIKTLLCEKEVFIPWIQVDMTYSYSYVRNLNVFEWLILQCMTNDFKGEKPDLTLTNIATIGGLDERGIEFFRPFLSNFVANNTVICNDSSNSDNLINYAITDDGYKLFLKGKTYVREKDSSIRLFYSPIICEYIKEEYLNFQNPTSKKMIFLKTDTEKFKDGPTPNLESFDFQSSMNSEKLTDFLVAFKRFSDDVEISINQNLIYDSAEWKWEKRTVMIGFDNSGALKGEVAYNDSNFNLKLTEKLNRGEISDDLIKINSERSEDIENGLNLREIKEWSLGANHFYLKEDLLKETKKKYENKKVSSIILSNIKTDEIMKCFKCQNIIVVSIGDENSSNFSEFNYDGEICYILSLFSKAINSTPFIIIDNLCYEEGKIRVHDIDNRDEKKYLEVVKEYSLENTAFYENNKLIPLIIKVGKSLEEETSKMDLTKKIDLFKAWNKAFGIYYNISNQLKQQLLELVSTKDKINEELIDKLMDWSKSLESSDLSEVLRKIYDIRKPTTFTLEKFPEDLEFKNKLDRSLKLAKNVLNTIASEYFLNYFPLLQLKNENSTDLNQIRVSLSQILQLNLEPLQNLLSQYLLNAEFHPNNLAEFLEFFQFFDIIGTNISEDAKQYLSAYVLENLIYLVDLKLQILDNSIPKKDRDRKKVTLFQTLSLIEKFQLHLPDYTIFQRTQGKKEVSILNHLKEKILNHEVEIKPVKKVEPTSEVSPNEHHKAIILDGSNIARNKQNSKTGNLNDVLTCKTNLISQGIPESNIYIIFGAGLRHNLINEKQKSLYEHLIKEKNINQTPKNQNDDWFIINFAMKLNGVIVSNDGYDQFRIKYPKIDKYLQGNTIKYTILANEIVFEPNFLEKIKIKKLEG